MTTPRPIAEILRELADAFEARDRQAPASEDDRLLTMGELRERWSCSAQTARERMEAQGVACVMLGKKLRRVRLSDVKRIEAAFSGQKLWRGKADERSLRALILGGGRKATAA